VIPKRLDSSVTFADGIVAVHDSLFIMHTAGTTGFSEWVERI